MLKLLVYRYLEFDPESRKYVYAPQYATAEAIDNMLGLVLAETVLRVNADRVDSQGFMPQPSSVGLS